MPEKNKDDWMKIASDFYASTHFPNCIGAVDGKHCRLQNPNNSGSLFFNYKHFFSMILMALVDSHCCFTAVDIGAPGKSSDSNVFKNSNFGNKLYCNQLNLPDCSRLPNDENGTPIPFVIVGDEAFALSENVLRPYPNKNLSVQHRIFNFRLSRARRVVECAFGILSNRWRIFHRPLDVKLEFCDAIIKACCILHNFLNREEGIHFEYTLYECCMENIDRVGVRGNMRGKEVRDYFASYFTSPQGAVPWQYDRI